jgi:pentatricopeptide repeat protein
LEVHGWISISIVLSKQRKYEEAEKSICSATKLAMSIEDEYYRLNLITVILEALAKQGRIHDAVEMVQQLKQNG